MRKCIGCGISKEKNTLVRIVRTDDGLELDRRSVLPGRGVYVCSADCLEKAVKKGGFQRSYKCSFEKDQFERIIKEFAEQ